MRRDAGCLPHAQQCDQVAGELSVHCLSIGYRCYALSQLDALTRPQASATAFLVRLTATDKLHINTTTRAGSSTCAGAVAWLPAWLADLTAQPLLRKADDLVHICCFRTRASSAHQTSVTRSFFYLEVLRASRNPPRRTWCVELIQRLMKPGSSNLTPRALATFSRLPSMRWPSLSQAACSDSST